LINLHKISLRNVGTNPYHPREGANGEGFQVAECGFRWNVMDLSIFERAGHWCEAGMVQFLSHCHGALTFWVVLQTQKGNCKR